MSTTSELRNMSDLGPDAFEPDADAITVDNSEVRKKMDIYRLLKQPNELERDYPTFAALDNLMSLNRLTKKTDSSEVTAGIGGSALIVIEGKLVQITVSEGNFTYTPYDTSKMDAAQRKAFMRMLEMFNVETSALADTLIYGRHLDRTVQSVDETLAAGSRNSISTRIADIFRN